MKTPSALIYFHIIPSKLIQKDSAVEIYSQNLPINVACIFIKKNNHLLLISILSSFTVSLANNEY